MSVLSLDEIMVMPYVKSRMTEDQRQEVAANYENCSHEYKQKLSIKLTKLNNVYNAIREESDPEKRKVTLFRVMTAEVAEARHRLEMGKVELGKRIDAEEKEVALGELDKELQKI